MPPNPFDALTTGSFSVEIDTHKIGTFTGVEGLSAKVNIEQRQEGGNNDFIHQFPSYITHGILKLSRAAGFTTSQVGSWMRDMGVSAGSMGSSRGTAIVMALSDWLGTPMFGYKIDGVRLISYSAPS